MLKTQNVIKPVILACSAGLFLTACATYEDDASYSASTMESTSIEESSGAQQGWQQGAASRSQDQYSSTQQQQQYSGQQSYSAQSGQSQQLQSGNELIIPLHEEQVNVGTRTVDAGTVTIRKVVTTETVNQPVQLRKETLVIDREGGSQASGAQFQGSASAGQSQYQNQGAQAQAEFNASEPAGAQQRTTSSQGQYSSGAASGNAFQEQTYTIQLREEQPVIQKNVVQTGQVVARKNAQTQRQTVQGEIRREDVRIDRGANAQNVEIRGNFDTAGRISEPSGAQQDSYQSEQQIDEPSGAEQQSVERSTTYQSETEIETERLDSDSRIGVEGDQFEDRQTLDDINQGSNTRGGAEDLQRFDEKATRP